MRGHSALLSALVERWRPETHTFHLLVGEVTVMLEDVTYILGLPVNGEPVTGYSWGAASLAHLYRSLYRASRFNCKEMDGPLILLFVWAWERMPFLAPIPRDHLVDVGVPLARRWSHWGRNTRYIRKPTAHFRRGLDDMGVDDVSFNNLS
ncbi:protein MAINTENANCE OF MERISTEMS-like [Arachis hypogaea]|uniref:protein MAINTENANCE OF MERISTEMS-like n=1 Tax=Arachis hypogaea TaxID=3818 RepID=UPI003B220184